MNQLDLPVHISPPDYPPRIVTVHLRSADMDVGLCGEGSTRDDPISEDGFTNCLSCILIRDAQ